ncbi:MAG: dipeptidase [Brevundimonas sp.]|uniref:dipeptidase n=1 Tax=Brevundimonas sp. TaxID=1871086 RepID=UPI0027282E1D|nr:dipeptidase [Brevundimonas sp.]MDO9587922.1 dipeptidase [Brevundimonas sp.]MDP3369253.1 dipeptidase [Brevundimonas sp.]MDP3656633.1 dipeptidase [Brevundimonas sp.]MDZ4110801.1 dipeptidase [Brevundimonas sp.]
MIRTVLLTTVALVLAAGPALAQAADPGEARARRILERTPLIDGHNDLPWALRQGHGNDPHAVDLTTNLEASTDLHTDIPRLRAGGVGGQFWSVYVPATMSPPDAAVATFEQIDTVKRLVAAHPETFELATTADDIQRIHRRGRIASLIGIEGGYSIDDSLGLLREFFDSGARYITLTHSRTTTWADSATDAPKWGGLSPFGEDVVREMNRLGMMVDLSHVSEETMLDAMRVSDAPVIFSHSSARAVTGHARNVPDSVLRLMPEDGGVVMITFVPGFVSETVRSWNSARSAEAARLGSLNPGAPGAVTEGMAAWTAANPIPRATIADVVAHIQHVRDVAGIDHVGLGGDYDGVEALPVGLEGVDAYPRLLAALMAEGWSEADIRKLAGENVLRVMRAVEATAASRRGERPSLARLPAAGAPE